MDNKNQPAFPNVTWDQLHDGTTVTTVGDTGLSKQEWFVGMALMGVASKNNPLISPHERAIEALQLADAALAILDQKQTEL